MNPKGEDSDSKETTPLQTPASNKKNAPARPSQSRNQENDDKMSVSRRGSGQSNQGRTTPDESERDEEGATPLKPPTDGRNAEDGALHSSEKQLSGAHEMPTTQPRPVEGEAN